MFKRNVALFVLGVCLPIVSTMSFSDAVVEETVYCDMVAERAWPPYKGECK